MATCSTSIFDEEIECKHTKQMYSFLIDDTNRKIKVNGVNYKFDHVYEESNSVVFIDDNCRDLVMTLELFGRLHAMALSGIHEFKALI